MLKKNIKTKNCPYCAEPILLAAIVCRYCGRDFPVVSTDFPQSSAEAPATPIDNIANMSPCPNPTNNLAADGARFVTSTKFDDTETAPDYLSAVGISNNKFSAFWDGVMIFITICMVVGFRLYVPVFAFYAILLAAWMILPLCKLIRRRKQGIN